MYRVSNKTKYDIILNVSYGQMNADEERSVSKQYTLWILINVIQHKLIKLRVETRLMPIGIIRIHRLLNENANGNM